MKQTNGMMAGLMVLAAWGLGGCGGGGGGSRVPSASDTATIQLRTFSDPWNAATPRGRDIANNLFDAAFRTSYRYSGASVSLSYAKQPNVPYFTGRITARGLKPNFAYQLKLAGKPVFGNRGTGTSASYIEADSRLPGARPVLHEVSSGGQATPVNGDDWTNQQLGYAGRWWDDTDAPATNIGDSYFQANYPQNTLYGYLFMGDFVTDETGAANVAINGSHSYHITWQDEQNGINDVVFGTFPVRSSSPFPGYGAAIPSEQIKLWYEYESARPSNVQLAPGTYHCRLLVTEEAFHGAGGAFGGIWQTVLATEEVRDSVASNDIVFTIH